MTNTVVHSAGELAFIDSFAGLIPCKVLAVSERTENGEPFIVCTVKVTADRPSYSRGELAEVGTRYVIPRTSVRVRSGQYRIVYNYAWRITESEATTSL